MEVNTACVRRRKGYLVARLKAEGRVRVLMARPSEIAHRDGL